MIFIKNVKSRERKDYLVDIDKVFFYEQTENTLDQGELIILPVEEEEAVQLQASLDGADSLLAADTPIEIDSGFGGRVKIANTTNKYLQTSVVLPTAAQVVVPTRVPCTAYIYVGFSGGVKSGTT